MSQPVSEPPIAEPPPDSGRPISPETGLPIERRTGDRRRRPKSRWQGKLIGVALSAVVLAFVYYKLDFSKATDVIAGADPMLVVLSCALILPLSALTALRFLWIVPRALPGFVEALRLTLVASALNLVLPAKLGDLGKSFFLMKRGNLSIGVSVSAVVMERIYDLFGLLTICLLGLLLGVAKIVPVHPAVFFLFGAVWLVSVLMISSERGAMAVCNGIRRLVGHGRLSKLADIAAGWPELLRRLGPRRFWLAVFSLGFWLLHLTQVWLFYIAVRADVPFMPGLVLSSLVLITALIPLGFAGIGVRDMAFVFFFTPYVPAEVSLAAATLCLSRVIVPPLASIPFLFTHGLLVTERRRTRLQYSRKGDDAPPAADSASRDAGS
jgi:glycosyltransferase 2 family protein